MKNSLSRAGRTGSPRLTGTARAVRAALLATSAAAAFAGAPLAFAGTCTQTATNEVTCSGVFTDNVTNSIPPANQVPDLTVILSAGTTVDPAAGVNGLTSNFGGDIAVYSEAAINTDGADGIYMYGSSSATLGSYGDIYTAVTGFGDNAIDLSASGQASATLGGNVSANSDAKYSVQTVSVRSFSGDASVDTIAGSSIGATAYDSTATALFVSGYDNANVSLYGDITSTSTYGDAYGVLEYATAGDASFYNAGNITVTGYDYATGASVTSTNGDATASNVGTISATASGDVNVYATGLNVGGYNAYAYNSGTIQAYATAADAAGSATAIALDVHGTYVDVENTGSLYAYATGYGASATAANVNSLDTLYVHNSGDISAVAYGDLGGSNATGLYGNSTAGDVTLVNDGSITATSDGTAIAVALYSNGYTTITNNGTIAAYGDNYGIAIATDGGLSSDYIGNYGTITGAIYTGAGDDTLNNDVAGTWNATGFSDFGAGDDTVLNFGNINMTDATISLGTYGSVAGNLFQNSGTLTASGDNYVDVGTGGLASGSVFVNDGVIDFQDGHADDSLTITGDFAGTGDINVDVEGDAGISDRLYIDGNVAAASRQTINVDLIDTSAPIAALIPIVEVSGDSTAANFSLGDVNFDPDNSFVNLDFSLVPDIDTTNATPDVFSLGIEVTGLTDTGTLAASIAPSVHSLIQTEVGTWRQRQGVIDAFNKGAVSLWARVFTEKSNFSPEFESSNIGPGGNFDYEQKNRGVEAGIDFAVTDEFSLGLLAAKSKADIDLRSGNANANIDADTWGVYGTWLSPTGFYLDASYRWTKFDTDMDSLAGPMHISGAKAETFNAEMGYAWTLSGGLKIEPQIQWTKTNVKDMDVLTTVNGMTFSSDGADSSRGRVGVAMYKGMGDADSGWRVTPYAALSAVREFDGENDFAINNSLFGRTTNKGTSALLELAVTAQHENWSVFGGLNWQDGGSIDHSLGGQLGVRYTFGGASPAPAPMPVAAPMPAKTCADLDDDGDGINNCDDKCMGSTTGQQVGADGCPMPAPEPEPVLAPKPYRN